MIKTTKNQRNFAPVWVPLFFGLMSLSNVITRPRFASYNKPDVIMLFMSGVLLGIALGGVFAFMRSRPRSS